MVFLYPAFLWGLLTLLIPLIIHLFNFQRPKVVYFSNVAFLREVKSTATSRNRLRHWLVLLARMLFLAFLVLAFARPVIPGENAEQFAAQGSRVSIFLDNSFSLQNETNGKALLDQGKQITEGLTPVFPAATSFQLLTNESTPRYFYKAATLEERLLETNFSETPLSWEELYRRQLRGLKQEGGKGHRIFWLSDFQKSTLGDINALEIDSTYEHILVPLRGEGGGNLLVDSVWLQNPFLQANENNSLNVRLRNTGSERVEERLLQFFIEDKQVASQSISMEGNSRQEIQLNFAVTSAGEKAARIEVEDYPLTFDNKHYFTLSIAPKIRTLTIGGDREARFASKVFENEPFFSHQYFSVTSIDFNAFAEADLVVIAHLPVISEALQSALTNFLAEGGTLVVFPPQELEATASYEGLLGMPIRNIETSEAVPLARPQAGDPFFEGVFERIASNMNLPQAKPVLNTSGTSILRFRDGRSFLSRSRRLKGKVFLFSSSLHPDASTFQKHALFVPTMYRIAFTSKRSLQPLAIPLTASNLRIALDSLRTNQIFQLESRTRPQQPIIPGQRVLGNELILELNAQILETGHYALVRKSDGKQVALLAFNTPSAESDLSVYEDEALQSFADKYTNVQLYDGSEALEVIRAFRDQNIATPLWRYFVLAALVALLLEIAFIRLLN